MLMRSSKIVRRYDLKQWPPQSVQDRWQQIFTHGGRIDDIRKFKQETANLLGKRLGISTRRRETTDDLEHMNWIMLR